MLRACQQRVTLDVVLEGRSCQCRGLLRKEGRQVFFLFSFSWAAPSVSAHADMVVEWLTCGHTPSDRHQAPADERSLGGGGWAQRYGEPNQKRREAGRVPIAGCEFGWWAGSRNGE